MKTILLTILILLPLASFAGGKGEGTYSLLATMPVSPGPKVDCSVSILINYQTAEIKAVRLDNPGGKWDLRNFMYQPDVFRSYGRTFKLQELFPGVNIHAADTVEGRFAMDKTGRYLRVLLAGPDGHKLSARRPMDDFLTAGTKCLQKN